MRRKIVVTKNITGMPSTKTQRGCCKENQKSLYPLLTPPPQIRFPIILRVFPKRDYKVNQICCCGHSIAFRPVCPFDMKFFLLLASVLAAASAVSYKDVLLQEFNLYKAAYQKKYENPLENFRRMEKFLETKYEVAQHNLRYKNGEETYEMEVNKFADWFPEEMANLNGFNKDLRDRAAAGEDVVFPEFEGKFYKSSNVTPPASINWVEKGAVAPVRDQGSCGSCYAFSALGSLQSLQYIKTKKMVVLSPQQIVDCSKEHGNQGCHSGTTGRTYNYIKDNGGVNPESAYPYENRDGKCRFDPKKVAAKVTGYVRVPDKEDALKDAIANIGPAAIGIHTIDSFAKYKSGVYTESKCRNDLRSLNHAVVIVGYGTDPATKQPYWLVQNSWGTDWGDKGYIKMAMNKNNMCGVATYALHPTL